MYVCVTAVLFFEVRKTLNTFLTKEYCNPSLSSWKAGLVTSQREVVV